MDVAIAGAHGKIGHQLGRLLADGGDRVRGLIRNPDHGAELRADGIEPVECDLEAVGPAEIAAAIEGTDAVVFAAGAGAGSGAERKWTVDRDGAVKLLEAAVLAGVQRYVIVSSVGAESPPDDDDDVFSVYLRAKAEADAAVTASDRDWTVLRPGPLTDDPPTGRVRLETQPFRGEVTRADVAAVLAACLDEPRSSGVLAYLAGGDDAVEAAVAKLT